MRATIPEEIKQARWIVKERQEMLAEAKREAERIVKEAREEQTQLISDEEVVKQAERQAEEIVEDARAREREIRLGRRGLRRRHPQHPRGEPREVHRRRAARPRPPAGPRRGRSRLGSRQRAMRPSLACERVAPLADTFDLGTLAALPRARARHARARGAARPLVLRRARPTATGGPGRRAARRRRARRTGYSLRLRFDAALHGPVHALPRGRRARPSRSTRARSTSPAATRT